MSDDILSDVLRSIRLRSAVFYFVSCEGEWLAAAPPSREIAKAVMPEAEHLMEFHVVTRGECWAAISGETPLKLTRGDVIMLPQGDAHVLSNVPRARSDADVDALLELQRNKRPFRLHYSGGSKPQLDSDAVSERVETKIVCGFIGCDARPFNPLLATLPRMLHLRTTGGGRSEQFAQFAAEESVHRGPGADALIERLSEMMFIDAIRQLADQLPQESTGWLAGLRDRFVGRALGLIHQNPEVDWTVEELARQVGLSRSALHERFVHFIGLPPMQYLAQWRMQTASRLLRETRASIASIALDVGYDSVASFSRAFKRVVGMPPAAWRRQQVETTEGAAPDRASSAPT